MNVFVKAIFGYDMEMDPNMPNQWLILPQMAYFCENNEKRHLVKLINLLT